MITVSNKSGDELPPGGWRGGEELPPGGWRGGEELPPGGWRATRDTYRTEDGNHNFTFDFVNVGSHYEIDIVSQPSYNGRASDGHSTHRLPSDRGGNKICFADNSIVKDLSSARKWAKAWAEQTNKYIKTGRTFQGGN